LPGRRSALIYGVSFGRFVKSDGVDFVAMSSRSFGQTSQIHRASFAGYRTANPGPRVGPLVINEICITP